MQSTNLSVGLIVKRLLKKAKKYRNDDRLLQLMVWQEFGLYLSPEQFKQFLEVPAAETISRERRRLRSIFPDSEQTQTRRYESYIAYKNRKGFVYTGKGTK